MGVQLRLPLVWAPAERSLAASIAAVTVAWTADAALSPSTTQRFAQTLARFTGFAAARGITTLAGVDPDLVGAFAAARHRTGRDATISAPSVTIRRARRAALRAFFGTAIGLRLTLDDPTALLHNEQPTGCGPVDGVRPLTDDEAALVRLYSQRARPTRHAATVALLLAGIHSCEAGRVTVADVDTHAGTVRVHGSRRYESRTLRLDAWSIHALATRAEHLRQHVPIGIGRSAVLCANALANSASRQASACAAVRDILTRAGLSEDPAVRPSSLTGHAARLVFDRTGRIEDAAGLLGSPSLDAAASLIGHQWGRRPR